MGITEFALGFMIGGGLIAWWWESSKAETRLRAVESYKRALIYKLEADCSHLSTDDRGKIKSIINSEYL
ncbi:hypothetical protein [Oceanisphaera sp.]|uniref:hypothetical protein n=1 Tax=Oceanisphaera sp. TaxID=1929979 RepID=UPI003A95CCEB